ncbi:MAG: PilZ domain-containing protein [Desulfobulbaceae bacterium]|nr:PilZ domain-containing protein [Desulfobulbaceae bacterium]
MTNNAEKRISQRFPKNTPVQFALAPQSNNESGRTKKPLSATIIDISATGMGIYTTSHISTGDCVYFVKDQPNWELPPKGKAMWSLKHNDGFRVGLEFIL